jgi:DNA-binding NarL/FixJ family response regulator
MKILIADDHALFRDGLALYLEKLAPEAVILQAGSYSQMFKLLSADDNMDFVFFDFEMADMPWQEALENLKKIALKTPFVIISGAEDNRTIKAILAAGAKGYIPKRSEIKVLNNALRLILDGGTYVPPNLIENIPQSLLNGKNQTTKNLTNRQSQVLDLIAQGKSNKQIAYDMGVSESTVKLHINALLRALHVSNRTQAVITAQKLGII